MDIDTRPGEWRKTGYKAGSALIYSSLVADYLDEQDASYERIDGTDDTLYVRIAADAVQDGVDHQHELRVRETGEVETRFLGHPDMTRYEEQVDHWATMESILRRLEPREMDVYDRSDTVRDVERLLEEHAAIG